MPGLYTRNYWGPLKQFHLPSNIVEADQLILSSSAISLLMTLHYKAAGAESRSRADHVEVKAATLANGLLHVDLVREIPEQLKPRQIPIGGGGAACDRGEWAVEPAGAGGDGARGAGRVLVGEIDEVQQHARARADRGTRQRERFVLQRSPFERDCGGHNNRLPEVAGRESRLAARG